MTQHRGIARIALLLVLGSVTAIGVLSWLLLANTSRPRAGSLVMYCAAGVQKPVAAAAEAYLEELGVEVQIQYGSSGSLLSAIEVAKKGDLFLAADESYIAIAREKHLLDEAIPVARIRPVIAVQKGNPKKIHALEDMLRGDVTIALCDTSASIGKLTKKLLEQAKLWQKFEDKSSVTAGTVNEAALKVAVAAVDAAFIWDANVRQDPKLEMVTVPAFDSAVQQVMVGVLKSCDHPADALQFARYLQAPEKGQPLFEKFGYETISGDPWELTPKLRVYSGGLNRIAIQDTIEEFKMREGVEVDEIYNGCGVLVNMMKAGDVPDVYFACDTSYMTQVGDKFGSPRDVSEVDMVLITAKGNPHRIQSLSDLTRPGLKVGAAHEYNSALGKLTKDLLQSLNLYDSIKPQIKVDPATADVLVNQLRVGALDVAIVYRANVAKVRDTLEIIDISQGHPTAVQPIAASIQSKHKYLAERLIRAITSAQSRPRFEVMAFRWRVDAEQP
ncbi:MAG: molybdate ABC transporter substrate-binding protein [Planctomycetaceae bacterium]